MCSYKGVRVSFEVWGLQSKVESYAHKVRIIITRFEFKANGKCPGPELIIPFSCSTQLSTKFQLLIKTKIS